MRITRLLLVLAMLGGALLYAAPAGASAAISVHAVNNAITLGQPTVMAGTSTPANATPIVVVQRRVGGKWGDRQSGTVKPDGTFRIGIKPSQSGIYALRVRSKSGGTISNTFYLRVYPPPPPTYYQHSGSGEYTTQRFNTPAEWAFVYTFNCAASQDGQSGNFIADATIDGPDEPFASLANDLAVSGGATNYVHNGDGSTYISIISECDWTIKVVGV